jgi:hypothetical protein
MTLLDINQPSTEARGSGAAGLYIRQLVPGGQRHPSCLLQMETRAPFNSYLFIPISLSTALHIVPSLVALGCSVFGLLQS